VTVIGPLLKAAPTTPELELVAGHVSAGPDPIEYGQVPEAVRPSESTTCSLNEPAAVGVPVIPPVDGFNVKPGGRVPTIEKVYGGVPPLTVGGLLVNGAPTSPIVRVAEHVIVGGVAKVYTTVTFAEAVVDSVKTTLPPPPVFASLVRVSKVI
jgi:hypothetical protein